MPWGKPINLSDGNNSYVEIETQNRKAPSDLYPRSGIITLWSHLGRGGRPGPPLNGKIQLLASSRKSWPKYEHDFEHMGLKAPISYGWDLSAMAEQYLHRNMWIHHGYFYSIGVGMLPRQELSAFAVLGYLRLDDSLCVTSSCFPHFPPLGPLLPEMIGRGREGYETWAALTTPFQFIFLF